MSKSIDYNMKRLLTRWLHDDRCPTCGNSIKERFEAHHSSYKNKGHERPDDIIPLCHVCHPVFEWAKRSRAEILAFAQDVQGRIEIKRIALEEVHEVWERERKKIRYELDAIEEKISLLLAIGTCCREDERDHERVAYFEAIDPESRGRKVPGVLAKLAAKGVSPRKLDELPIDTRKCLTRIAVITLGCEGSEKREVFTLPLRDGLQPWLFGRVKREVERRAKRHGLALLKLEVRSWNWKIERAA